MQHNHNAFKSLSAPSWRLLDRFSTAYWWFSMRPDDSGPALFVVVLGSSQFSWHRCYHRRFYRGIHPAINGERIKLGPGSGNSGLFIWHGVVLNVACDVVVVLKTVMNHPYDDVWLVEPPRAFLIRTLSSDGWNSGLYQLHRLPLPSRPILETGNWTHRHCPGPWGEWTPRVFQKHHQHHHATSAEQARLYHHINMLFAFGGALPNGSSSHQHNAIRRPTY
jgi:hypothetical protein